MMNCKHDGAMGGASELAHRAQRFILRLPIAAAAAAAAAAPSKPLPPPHRRRRLLQPR